jgi:DNA-binding winged helix-turn-helix (wHTH) protein
MSAPSSSIAEELSATSPVTTRAFRGRYARFGTFEVDLGRAELYQNGQRVKVQAKLFQALLLLLGRAGEVVTREEVRRQLWPDSFLASLDANVNTTMNKLRQVLGDSPENPAYIETIPRRGYSFMASVEFSEVPGAPSAKRENKELGKESRARAAGTLWWSKNYIPVLLRATSLLIAGMILGALLAFLWFFAQAKNARAANGGKVKVSTVVVVGQFNSPKASANSLTA